jgi:hypothetical protein
VRSVRANPSLHSSLDSAAKFHAPVFYTMQTFITFPTTSANQKTTSAGVGKKLLYCAQVFGAQVLAVCNKVGACVLFARFLSNLAVRWDAPLARPLPYTLGHSHAIPLSI